MPIRCPLTNDGLSRSGAFLDVTNDWTRCLWLRYDDDTVDYYTAWEVINPSGGVFYVGGFAYPDAGQFVQDLEIWNGSLIGVVKIPITDVTWFHFAVRYTASTGTFAVFIDAVLNTSVVASVASAPAIVTDYVGSDQSASLGGMATSHDRIWQAALTATELAIERTSFSAVRTSNLLSDTPLTNASTLTDSSGNGHGWSVTGSVSFLPGPNTSFANAMSVGTVPVTISQVADVGGATSTLYYVCTPGTNGLGVWAFGDLSVYKPVLTFWSDVSTQVFGTATNVPAQIPTTASVPVYFKVTPNGGNPTPAALTLSVVTAPTSTAVSGDLFINDSTDTYPGIVMDPSTAEPKRFVHPFAAGEGVVVLQDGTICAIDAFTVNGPIIYRSDFTIRVTPTMASSSGLTAFNDCLGTNQLDTFWAGSSGGGATHAKIAAITASGVVSTAIDLGSAALDSLSPTADNSAIYYTKNQSSTNQAVFKVTNPAGTVTTFLAGVANYFFGANVMMLTDDTLLVPYARTSNATLVKRYDLSANLLNTYTFGVDLNIEHIFADPADPAFFWIWTQAGIGGGTFNSFTRVKVSDGTTTTAGPWVQYISGVYQDVQSATPSARFGADFSCVPIVLRGSVTTSTTSGRRGIYVPTRGVGGSEGGGQVRFRDLGGYVRPASDDGGGTATGTLSGRIVHVPLEGSSGMSGLGSGRAIYIPPNAEGNTPSAAQRTVVVPIGTEGYSHR